jgi:hypothetical protein
MYIFACQSDFGWISTGPFQNATVLKYGKGDSIDSIVRDVNNIWLGSDGDIEGLFLVGHGNAGVIWLGEGIGPVRATKFSKLRGNFSPQSLGIRVHGCACASSTDITRGNGTGTRSNDPNSAGYKFLASLAVSGGVSATGSVNSMWGFNAAYSFKDVPTMTVLPGGSSYFLENEGIDGTVSNT